MQMKSYWQGAAEPGINIRHMECTCCAAGDYAHVQDP